jgi:hypothetical protein
VVLELLFTVDDEGILLLVEPLLVEEMDLCKVSELNLAFFVPGALV